MNKEVMMKKEAQADKARRNFLRGSVVAGAGATVAVTMPAVALDHETEQPPAEKDENYRLTRHISDYYKSTL